MSLFENLQLAWQLLPHELLNTLYMVFASGILSLVFGVFLGVVLVVTENKWLYKMLGGVINIGRSIPFAILMIALIPLTRFIMGTSIGTTAAIVPLTLAASPFMARLTEMVLRKVDPSLIDAATVMGATKKQIVWKVMLAESRVQLLGAWTTTLVTLVSYSAMAGLVGGGGLGKVAIQYGYQRFNGFLMVLTLLVLWGLVEAIQLAGNRLIKCVQLLILCCFFSSCASQTKTLKVAATSVPHAEMLAFIQPEMEKRGYKLKIVEVDDYQLPNRLLCEGEVDANFFQHLPFFQVCNNGELEVFGIIHYEPLGIYSSQIKSLGELKEGARIAVPSDPTNESRALHLLAEKGLIQLRKQKGCLTVLDIDCKSFTINEIDAPLLPRVVEEVDLAVIPANFALQGGVVQKYALLAVETQETYPNVLVIRKGEQGREELQFLKEFLTSGEMREFIKKKYKGAVIPLF